MEFDTKICNSVFMRFESYWMDRNVHKKPRFFSNSVWLREKIRKKGNKCFLKKSNSKKSFQGLIFNKINFHINMSLWQKYMMQILNILMWYRPILSAKASFYFILNLIRWGKCFAAYAPRKVIIKDRIICTKSILQVNLRRWQSFIDYSLQMSSIMFSEVILACLKSHIIEICN